MVVVMMVDGCARLWSCSPSGRTLLEGHEILKPQEVRHVIGGVTKTGFVGLCESCILLIGTIAHLSYFELLPYLILCIQCLQSLRLLVPPSFSDQQTDVTLSEPSSSSSSLVSAFISRSVPFQTPSSSHL